MFGLETGSHSNSGFPDTYYVAHLVSDIKESCLSFLSVGIDYKSATPTPNYATCLLSEWLELEPRTGHGRQTGLCLLCDRKNFLVTDTGELGRDELKGHGRC